VLRAPQQPMLFGTTSANTARVPVIYTAVVYISFHDIMRMKREQMKMCIITSIDHSMH